MESSTIQAINLWFYRGKRLSSWHYDGHDNFLFQLEGAKLVKLLSPLAGMQGRSVFSVNSNHHADRGSRITSKMEVRCRIGKGECLFIPRGWWHEVQSEG
jgi:ribosomal protein L16 Arg81 hydroxylase